MASTPRRRVRAYVGLGGNVGDPSSTLVWAVAALDRLDGARVRSVSRLYATAPWGEIDQPEFRNAAVAIDVATPSRSRPDRAALDLLAEVKEIEREAGRRPGRRWGPRPLDIDLLLFGRHRIAVERSAAARSVESDTDPARAARLLEVPHRDLGERLFVLAPLADIAPRLVPPGWHETVATRRDAVAAETPPGDVRVVGTWDARLGRWTPTGDGVMA